MKNLLKILRNTMNMLLKSIEIIESCNNKNYEIIPEILMKVI